MPAHLEVLQVPELFFSDTRFSADGRMNIDSKRTSNHDGDLDLREFLETSWDCQRCGCVDVHSASEFQQLGVSCTDADPGRDPS
jgi:hypothetical protein